MAAARRQQGLFGLAIVALAACACGDEVVTGSPSRDGATESDAVVEGSIDPLDAPGPDVPDADVTDADAGADAATWTCTDPLDGGPLSPPEVVASNRAALTELGISDSGPVWLELHEYDYAQVLLGTTPPRLLYDTRDGSGNWDYDTSTGIFRTAGRTVGFLFDRFGYWSGSLVVGSISTGNSVECTAPYVSDLALDDTRMYVLAQHDNHSTIFTYPVAAAYVADPCAIDGGATFYDLGSDSAYLITEDESNVYVLVGFSSTSGTYEYEIRSVPKVGGPAKPFLTSLNPDSGWVTIVAHNGTVTWTTTGKLGVAHAITAYNRKWSQPRLLVDEAAGIGGPPSVGGGPYGVVIGDGRVAVALDDTFLYWATADGFVKRIRLCGGIPEILASNQDDPIAIAVDDNAVYWLDRGTKPGTGTVMRMRKLDAPGYSDAGITDADASAEDADGGD